MVQSLNIPQGFALDRRRSPRVPLVVAVRQTCGARMWLCQSLDVSLRGMALRRPRDAPLPILGPAHLEFSLPGEQVVLTLRGRVVRDTEDGPFRAHAVRFDPLGAALRGRLSRYLIRHASGF